MAPHDSVGGDWTGAGSNAARHRFSNFTTHALEAAGIPVIELHSDNVDRRAFDQEAIFGSVSHWLEAQVLLAADRRRTG